MQPSAGLAQVLLSRCKHSAKFGMDSQNGLRDEEWSTGRLEKGCRKRCDLVSGLLSPCYLLEDLSQLSVGLIEFQAGNYDAALQLFLKAYEECQDVGLLSNASLAALLSGRDRAQLPCWFPRTGS